MTNKNNNMLSYMFSSLVQSEVINEEKYYFLNNLTKLNNNYFNVYNNG